MPGRACAVVTHSRQQYLFTSFGAEGAAPLLKALNLPSPLSTSTSAMSSYSSSGSLTASDTASPPRTDELGTELLPHPSAAAGPLPCVPQDAQNEFCARFKSSAVVLACT